MAPGRFPSWTIATSLILAGGVALGGEFDRLEGDRLEKITRTDRAKRRERITVREIDALPQALGDERSALLVLKTDQGNYARLLVSLVLRKPSNGPGAATPVLLLERFDTFESGKTGARVATGKGMVLFDGFQVDLDAGIVVPENQGGDLAFAINEAGGPTVKALGSAALFTLSRRLQVDTTPTGPSPGKAIIPGDFSGRFRLYSDGRWSGLLELDLVEGRSIKGHFRSDEKGTSYDVTGEVAAEIPQKLAFTVKFPRSEQVYEGFLWTEGKNAMSGSFAMQGRTFGFFAVREGTDLDPQKRFEGKSGTR